MLSHFCSHNVVLREGKHILPRVQKPTSPRSLFSCDSGLSDRQLAFNNGVSYMYANQITSLILRTLVGDVTIDLRKIGVLAEALQTSHATRERGKKAWACNTLDNRIGRTHL